MEESICETDGFLSREWETESVMDGESEDRGCDEVNQESEQIDVDEMNGEIGEPRENN